MKRPKHTFNVWNFIGALLMAFFLLPGQFVSTETGIIICIGLLIASIMIGVDEI